MVIFPWIRGGEPVSNRISRQLGACQTISTSRQYSEILTDGSTYPRHGSSPFWVRFLALELVRQGAALLSPTKRTGVFRNVQGGIFTGSRHWIENRVRLLPADDTQSLKCDIPELVLRKSVQPLEGFLDVFVCRLAPQKSLRFVCVALSKVIRQRGRTHLFFVP